jgi:hypothetical protein
MDLVKDEGAAPPVYCGKTNGILLQNERGVAPLKEGEGPDGGGMALGKPWLSMHSVKDSFKSGEEATPWSMGGEWKSVPSRKRGGGPT